MTRNLECLCKYRSPCAIPSIIARRVFQFSKALLVSSANQLSIDIIEENFGTQNLCNDLVKLSTKINQISMLELVYMSCTSFLNCVKPWHKHKQMSTNKI